MKIHFIPICMSTLIASLPMVSATDALAQNPDAIYSTYETYNGSDLEMTLNASGTHFRLWSPSAQAVRLKIYPTGRNSASEQTIEMTRDKNGTWTAGIPQKLYGKFYTFQILHNGKWLDETPGVWAKAVGINGNRGAIIDFDATNPEGWDLSLIHI